MQPNIIIINPDQMRADSMGHLGNAAAHTPNLDALAQEGVSFSAAFCQNPVCVPSRCSFMTGLYPHTAGHRTMGHLQQPGEENLFSDFKQAGYYTISSTRGDLMAGQYPKYHRELIDEYILFKRPKHSISRYIPDRGDPAGGSFFSFMGGVIPTNSPEDIAPNMDDLLIENAIQSIQKRPKDKPFFMFLGLVYPHPTYQIERKYYDLIDPAKLPPRIPVIQDGDGKPLMERGLRDALPVSGWEDDRLDDLRRVYLAMCAKTDDQIGRLLAALRAQGLYDDTAVLMFSDHGDYTGDYGIVEKSQNCFPDCLVNVPLIIKPPKGTPVDSGVNHNLAELTDICATVSELAGVPLHRTHFSRSLLPTIADKSTPHRAFVTCEGGRLPGETQCMEYDPAHFDPHDLYAPRMLLQAREDGTHGKAVMLRTIRHKYIRRLEEPDEFYDLAQGERVNQIDNPAYTQAVLEMQLQLLDWYQRTCDTVPKQIDERFTAEFLRNNVTALGIPRFAGALLQGALRVAGISPGRFINWARHIAEGGAMRGRKKK